MESQCERCNKKKKKWGSKRKESMQGWADTTSWMTLRQPGSGTVRLLIPDLSKDTRPCLFAGGFSWDVMSEIGMRGEQTRSDRWGHSFQLQCMRRWKNEFSKRVFCCRGHLLSSWAESIFQQSTRTPLHLLDYSVQYLSMQFVRSRVTDAHRRSTAYQKFLKGVLTSKLRRSASRMLAAVSSTSAIARPAL